MKKYYICVAVLHLIANTTAFLSDEGFPLRLVMGEEKLVSFKLYNVSKNSTELISENVNVANVTNFEFALSGDVNFTVKAHFLGKTFINLYENGRKLNENFEIIVTREERLIDKMFKYSIAILMTVMFINFGACLDMTKMRQIIVKPLAPFLGLISQFLFMPVMSYFIGLLLFPDDCELQLGTFFTGISPGGGSSNLWTVILGGNVNLSVAMTTISTISAFGMMPLWIFTLGKLIFDCANLGLPYKNLMFLTLGLVMPIFIGVFIQKKWPSVAKLIIRLIKPLSIMLIIFIGIFAIMTNLYIFKLLNWRIIVAGLGLPWSGFLFGYLMAKLFHQPDEDVLAISIETGIQNTAIAIFLLKFTLEQPAADISTIIPISNAMLTPIPLLVLTILQKICKKKRKKEITLDPEIQHDISANIEELLPMKNNLTIY